MGIAATQAAVGAVTGLAVTAVATGDRGRLIGRNAAAVGHGAAPWAWATGTGTLGRAARGIVRGRTTQRTVGTTTDLVNGGTRLPTRPA